MKKSLLIVSLFLLHSKVNAKGAWLKCAKQDFSEMKWALGNSNDIENVKKNYDFVYPSSEVFSGRGIWIDNAVLNPRFNKYNSAYSFNDGYIIPKKYNYINEGYAFCKALQRICFQDFGSNFNRIGALKNSDFFYLINTNSFSQFQEILVPFEFINLKINNINGNEHIYACTHIISLIDRYKYSTKEQ